MIALLQRVAEASVAVDDATVGAIGRGLLVFLGVERADAQHEAERLLARVLGYRVFPDEHARMNLSVGDVGGGLLVVPQFTLAADTAQGLRPSFSPAAPPAQGESLFEHFVACARDRHPRVETGRFGQRMQVRLCNDGPVTFWLQVAPRAAARAPA